ncbi:hypothetical protein PAER4782_34060 (plasmid) [Pseudomonas aeruginosa]|nr:hypothetical protein PAER4782_34060 [Pseudomonas aeruginosa]CAI9912112.1 hypothetical protein PAER4782_34060 [Pseudomonas aeruginosa]
MKRKSFPLLLRPHLLQSKMKSLKRLLSQSNQQSSA